MGALEASTEQEAGILASRAAPVPGAMAGQGTREAMADRGAWAAMADRGTREAMADPGTQEAPAPTSVSSAGALLPPKKFPWGN